MPQLDRRGIAESLPSERRRERGQGLAVTSIGQQGPRSYRRFRNPCRLPFLFFFSFSFFFVSLVCEATRTAKRRSLLKSTTAAGRSWKEPFPSSPCGRRLADRRQQRRRGRRRQRCVVNRVGYRRRPPEIRRAKRDEARRGATFFALATPDALQRFLVGFPSWPSAWLVVRLIACRYASLAFSFGLRTATTAFDGPKIGFVALPVPFLEVDEWTGRTKGPR